MAVNQSAVPVASSPARIVYVTNGMASTLNSSFELSRRLTARGHSVVYVSHKDVEAEVAGNGYPFHRLTADEALHELRRAETAPWSGGARPGPLAVLAWIRRCRAIRRRSAASDEIETLVAGLRPDLLIIDVEMHYAVIATARLAIPTVLTIVWFSIFRRPGLPPLHLDLPVATTRGERLRVRLAWLRSRATTIALEWRRRFSRRGLEAALGPMRYGTVQLDDLRLAARARGFDLRRETDRSHWLRPFVYRRHPVLCFNAREMDFPHEPHPLMRYVGPMVHGHRNEGRIDPASRARWEALLRARAAGDGAPRPLVYCSLGTFWAADRDFLRKVIEVFERRREWELLLGLGGKLQAADLAPVPENATLLDYAPQLEVLEHAACAITHGGITTINECVRAGVPMVVYSTRHVDQDGCAARVAHHGLGVVGDKDADTSRELERNVERVLGDEAVRASVEAMRERFARYEADDPATGQIEAMLAAGR